MISKVLTMTLLTICAADNRVLPPKRNGSQGLPTQRFSKHNMPISVKYGEGLQYSTPSPILRPGPLVPNIYQRIQYAPLHKNTAAEYTKVTPTLSSSAASTEADLDFKNRRFYGKHYLEPRVPTDEATTEKEIKCQSHKIEVKPSSVSRSPGHNAVYRNFPEIAQREKPFKVNYMRPYGGYENLGQITTTMMPFELPHENVAKPFIINNQHFVLNPNSVEGEGPFVEKIKRQYSPYSKFHRIHLNIARVYSPGQLPAKSPVFADTYSLNYGRLPVHSQAYIPPVYQDIPDQKTVLFPIKEEQRKYRFRLP